jgi:RpiB/LacA/LacB family sugar-phosphate isomerase
VRIAVGTDHAGHPLKGTVLEVIRSEGHEGIDLGTHSQKSVDYPDYAEKVGRSIQSGEAERGIILCGSGVGAAIAANKLEGIRAGVCHDTYSAHQSVEHDDANVLALGARVIGPEIAKEIVSAFLRANFSGAERHMRRVGKIKAIEERERRREDA